MNATFAPLARLDAAARARILALNNAHARETSYLEAEGMEALVAEAFLSIATPAEDAFLIAFAPDAAYDSPNFQWFRARYPRFAYVDRVVVGASARGQGAARALYTALAEAAGRAGLERIVCEVNSDPPNPGSDAFHARLGFEVVGEARLADQGKAVRYYALDLR